MELPARPLFHGPLEAANRKGEELRLRQGFPNKGCRGAVSFIGSKIHSTFGILHMGTSLNVFQAEVPLGYARADSG